CASPPASLQMALTYPQRRAVLGRRPLAYVALYLPFLGLGGGLLSSMPDPSLFLPLLYTVYLFTANAALLYVGGLVLGLIDGLRPREPIVLSLAAVLGSGGIGLAILVTYPLLQRPISPAVLVGPLLLLPLPACVALLRCSPPARGPPPRFARSASMRRPSRRPIWSTPSDEPSAERGKLRILARCAMPWCG